MMYTVFEKPLVDNVLLEEKDGAFEKKNNTAPNTIQKYADAALWAETHGAWIVEYPASKAYPHGFFRVEPLPAPTAEELLQDAKAERAATVAAIVVTVDGMTFDGDETSQTRMGRALSGAIALGVDLKSATRKWVLADGTIAYPTYYQLAQALQLAGDGQTEIWDKPYRA